MDLTSQAVEEVFNECLGTDVEVEGIVRWVKFDKARLDEHAERIKEMLLELPEQFRASTAPEGGGWSFLNACMDRHGRQWTGLHRTMEALFMLGMAIDFVELLLPREMWAVLYGGMPYYQIKDV